ncbi:hypothetical protein BM221_010620 [Beauveria bassiana]|uniref:Heat Labile Enterotoxin Type Iib n=1 Tax=Beauveria bassiana TaxID=176275 RepID=A0A2N6N8B3_BEABA|nr:hypothetical protein BM221_010620 [Beauveria bassiana]
MNPQTAAFLINVLGFQAGLSVAAGEGVEGDTGRMTLGFRSVGQQEKELLTKTGSLIQSRNTFATHIGDGVYLGNSPIQRDGDSLFVVTADEAAFKATSKAWIPEEYWTLPGRENDKMVEREAAISRDQLEYYMEDLGLQSSRTVKLARLQGAASDDVMQMLIPNDMIAHDQNGAPIDVESKLDTKVEPTEPSYWSVDYDEWEGILGSKVYTKESLRERSAALTEKATKAVTDAEKLIEADSPAAAKAMEEALAVSKRCAEGMGHFHRRRPDWVEFDDFNTVYEQYANARKASAKLRKMKLTKAVEAQKSKLTEAAEKLDDDATRAAAVAEAQEAAAESNKLVETAAKEMADVEKAHTKLEKVRGQLDGGEQEEFIDLLAENPRAVWATLQESFTSMNGKEAASLDAAIKNEADITQAEYSILQEGVNEAKAMATEIGEMVTALKFVAEKPEILCQRAGGFDCVHVSTDESRPTGEEKPVKTEPVDEGELIAVARQRSKESFDNLLEEFDYKSVVKHDQLYKELNERLPEFNPVSRTERITGLSAKFGEGALAVAGIALYGKAVAEVFSGDASVLDKAAVVTSILPGIGCAVQLADSIEHGHVDATHTALCFVEDALFVTGFWEIALVMQVGEELGNWIQAEDERDRLWDMDLLAQKGAEGWLDNVKRLIKHLKSDEFVANATTQLSTYKILTLYQASQLTGDLHAAHQVLENAAMPAHAKPELKRQICSTFAESKFQLQTKLEAIALNHTAKLEREFKKKFLDDWLKAATTPTPIFGITIPDWPSNTRRITEEIDRARNMPLPLYEAEVKKAIRHVIERLETPAPCQCVQGRKGGKCEFGDCQSPKPGGRMDAGGRLYATSVQSMERAQRIRLTPECQGLFTTCPVGSTASDIGRPLWCTPGK